MGDSCWPRDAQACLVQVRLRGFGRAKRGGAARATRQQKELQFRIGSEQSRAKRGDGRGWSDRRTGRERAPAQRSQSIALRVARMLVWSAEQRPDGDSIRSFKSLVQLFFFQLVSSALVARGARTGRMRRCWAGLAEEAEARAKHDGDAASGDEQQKGKKGSNNERSKGFGRILMLLCAGGFRVGTLRVR